MHRVPGGGADRGETRCWRALAMQPLDLLQILDVDHGRRARRVEEVAVHLRAAHPGEIFLEAVIGGGDIALAIAEDDVEQGPERVPDEAHIRLERPVEGRAEEKTRRRDVVEDGEAEVEQGLDALGRVDEGLDVRMLAGGGAHLEQGLHRRAQPGLVGHALERVDETLFDRRGQGEVVDPFQMLAADQPCHRALLPVPPQGWPILRARESRVCALSHRDQEGGRRKPRQFGEIAGILAADHVDRAGPHPGVGEQAVGLLGDAVVKRGLHPPAAQHPVRRDALFEALGAPGDAAGCGGHRPGHAPGQQRLCLGIGGGALERADGGGDTAEGQQGDHQRRYGQSQDRLGQQPAFRPRKPPPAGDDPAHRAALPARCRPSRPNHIGILITW